MLTVSLSVFKNSRLLAIIVVTIDTVSITIIKSRAITITGDSSRAFKQQFAGAEKFARFTTCRKIRLSDNFRVASIRLWSLIPSA